MDKYVAGQNFWLLQSLCSKNKSWYTWISIFSLLQTHPYTSQERFICRNFVVVDPSLYSLALHSNVTGQCFWLLQPLFCNHKSWKTWISVYCLSKPLPIPVRESLFEKVLWWLNHLHSLALASNMAGQHFWLCQPLFSNHKS